MHDCSYGMLIRGIEIATKIECADIIFIPRKHLNLIEINKYLKNL